MLLPNNQAIPILPAPEDTNLKPHMWRIVQMITSSLLYVGYYTDDRSLWLCMNAKSIKDMTSDDEKFLLPILIPEFASSHSEAVAMDEDESFGSDVSFLYSCLQMHVFDVTLPFPDRIESEPYPHQKLAVSWMCSREGVVVSEAEEQRIRSRSQSLHPIFTAWPPQPSACVCLPCRILSLTTVPNTIFRQGGVLCDTMGIGKTFEILALILMHPRPESKIEDSETLQRYRQIISPQHVSLDTRDMKRLLRELLSRFDRRKASPEEREDTAFLFAKERDAATAKVRSEDCVAPAFLKRAPRVIRKENCSGWDNTPMRSVLHLRRVLAPVVAREADSLLGVRDVPTRRMHVVGGSGGLGGSGSSPIDVSPDWYVCHDCQKKEAKTVRIASKTTLVFTPAHICIQWIEELRKHVRATESDTHVITGSYCEGCVNGVRYLFYPGCNVLMKGIIAGSGRRERRR